MTGYIAGTAYTYERSIDISFMVTGNDRISMMAILASMTMHRYEVMNL